VSKHRCIDRAFERARKEVFANEPSTVDQSKSKGEKNKQKIAIAFSKARERCK